MAHSQSSVPPKGYAETATACARSAVSAAAPTPLLPPLSAWMELLRRWSGVAVVGPDGAGLMPADASAGLVTHQLVDNLGRDAGVLQPGREGVPEVVGAVQVDRLQQGTLGGELLAGERSAVAERPKDAGGGRPESSGGLLPGGSRRRITSTTCGARGISRMLASL
jgi:hypothetical protein